MRSLIEACNGDETLRQEVESLLRFESASLQFLERPAAGIAGALASSPVGKAMVGRQLGPTASSRRSAPAAWARSIARAIVSSGATWRSRSCRAFHRDPERRARFAREARLLATLNHPNIGAIYGLEEADGITALVLELVEGQTLADRLQRGPLKVSDALAIARQIAEALDAAHEKGIVHRDLKPANIILQGAGLTSSDVRVKVLDFGLAKLVHADPEADATPSGTLQSTEDGRILGTPAYMSPEQARGLPIDKRTDIWGFGCVLFEMLTGQQAFAGDTLSDVLVRIIEHEPDWQMLPVRTPASICRLLHRCFEKDPKRRLDSAAVARIEIDEAGREPTPIVEAAGARRGSLWQPIAWAATGAGVAVLVTMMLAGGARSTEPPGALVATSVFVDGVVLSVGTARSPFRRGAGRQNRGFRGEYGGSGFSIGAISTESIQSRSWAPKAEATFSSLMMAGGSASRSAASYGRSLSMAALRRCCSPTNRCAEELGERATESSSVAWARGCGWLPPPAASLVSSRLPSRESGTSFRRCCRAVAPCCSRSCR